MGPPPSSAQLASGQCHRRQRPAALLDPASSVLRPALQATALVRGSVAWLALGRQGLGEHEEPTRTEEVRNRHHTSNLSTQ